MRNIGPIREADIDLRPLTVFIGPQATGKSLTMETIYFFQQLGDILSLEEGLGRLNYASFVKLIQSSLERIYANPLHMK
jgi:predicted ATPase